ncbi:MAG: ornithine cyclodeaminase family protein [Geminicoccaceae bacterium]
MILTFVDADTLHQNLPFATLIDDLDEAHRDPPPEIGRVLLEKGEQGYLVLPAWQEGKALGTKLVTSFPDNRMSGQPTVQGLYVLFDGTNGSPAAVIDGEALTFRKTAADSALGARYLARENARTLLMIGAGSLAPWLVEAHRTVRPSIERVMVWNRTRTAAERLARACGGEVVDNLDEAIGLADIVCSATGSRSPLVRGRLLKPGAHVDLVGGFTPEMRESDDDTMRRGSIHVDATWSTVGMAGDLTQPMQSGAIEESAVLGDLFDLATGRIRGRANDREITVFKNGGGAHLDLMTAMSLMRRLQRPA